MRGEDNGKQGEKKQSVESAYCHGEHCKEIDGGYGHQRTMINETIVCAVQFELFQFEYGSL